MYGRPDKYSSPTAFMRLGWIWDCHPTIWDNQESKFWIGQIDILEVGSLHSHRRSYAFIAFLTPVTLRSSLEISCKQAWKPMLMPFTTSKARDSKDNIARRRLWYCAMSSSRARYCARPKSLYNSQNNWWTGQWFNKGSHTIQSISVSEKQACLETPILKRRQYESPHCCRASARYTVEIPCPRFSVLEGWKIHLICLQDIENRQISYRSRLERRTAGRELLGQTM